MVFETLQRLMKRIGDFHQRRILQFCAFSISCFSIYSILLHYHFHPDHEPQFQEWIYT